MRKILAAVMAAGLLGAIAAFGSHPNLAGASEWWCWDDPVLIVNGQVLHIYSGVPASALKRVTLAEMVITVPEGVDARITANNAPRFPQVARLVRAGRVGADGSIPITATVTVHGHGSFAAALKIAQPGGSTVVAYGESNQPIISSLMLLPRTVPAAPASSGRAASRK